MADSGQNTTQEMRRKRIKLYKKIIVFFLLFLILLPTIFCVILFVRVGHLERQLNVLMAMRVSETDDDLPGDTTQEAKTDRNINPDYVYANETESDTSTEAGTVDAAENETPELEERDSDKHVSGQPQDGVHGAYSETMVEEALQDGRKVVYLTFDDGPSHNTERILDILDEYNVKATFFTIGNEAEEFVDVYKRIIEDGHSLGMHSYSHKYSEIYKSVEAFDADFNKVSGYIESVTGAAPKLYRFPGGSSNLVSAIPMENFIRYLNEKNVTYFDWNVSAQDAEGKELPVETMLDNIFKDINKKDICVVLMHDSDDLGTTVDMLPELLKRLVEMDAVILPITENTTLIQHIASDSVQ